jgi:hypothetical protein
VTPLTNPAFIARMRELDAKFLAMKTDMHGVASNVEPIDWKYWGQWESCTGAEEARASGERGNALTRVVVYVPCVSCDACSEENIDNKAVVESLRKEYESMKFEDAKGEDLTKVNADLDVAIAKATGAADISREQLPKLQAELQAAIEEKRSVHNWTLEDFYARYPGLREQLREEYNQGEFLLSDAEERLEAQDVNEARKQFKAGAEISMPDDLPERVGDFSLQAELKKTDALLERMFGGSKQFEQLKQDARDKEAKRAAAAAKAAHH